MQTFETLIYLRISQQISGLNTMTENPFFSWVDQYSIRLELKIITFLPASGSSQSGVDPKLDFGGGICFILLSYHESFLTQLFAVGHFTVWGGRLPPVPLLTMTASFKYKVKWLRQIHCHWSAYLSSFLQNIWLVLKVLIHELGRKHFSRLVQDVR